MKAAYIAVLLGASIIYALNLDHTIQTSSGPVKGHLGTFNNHTIAYLGIPYAVPPIEKLRFMPPVRYNSNTTINGSSIVSLRLYF
jgi:hypothetical protein